MTSFIYQLAQEYEQEHGFRPNVLYLNQIHFNELQGQLSEIRNLGAMSRLLGMEIVLDSEIPKPLVCWSSIDWRRAVAV